MRFSVRFQAATAAFTVAAAASLTAAIAPVATAATPIATGSAPVSGHLAAVTAREQRAALRYWTRARMERAVPVGSSTATPLTLPGLPGLPGLLAPPLKLLATPAHGVRSAHHRQAAGGTGSVWQHGGAVARATGKIFFTLGGTDYVCSGATVDGRSADVAVTAAHCTSNGGGAWATNWTFVPGYHNGNAPYGTYTARRFFAPSQWTSNGTEDYDAAFVVLNPATVGGVRRQAVAAAGGLGIAFGRQPGREYAFGYPSESPYNGQQLYYCSGSTAPDPYHATTDTGLNCDMTEGASGGPWLSGFDPATGVGTITSVSTFKYDDGSAAMFGPDFGPAIKSLYTAAEHAP